MYKTVIKEIIRKSNHAWVVNNHALQQQQMGLSFQPNSLHHLSSNYHTSEQ